VIELSEPSDRSSACQLEVPEARGVTPTALQCGDGDFVIELAGGEDSERCPEARDDRAALHMLWVDRGHRVVAVDRWWSPAGLSARTSWRAARSRCA
jgi:hypothetical protein